MNNNKHILYLFILFFSFSCNNDESNEQVLLRSNKEVTFSKDNMRGMTEQENKKVSPTSFEREDSQAIYITNDKKNDLRTESGDSILMKCTNDSISETPLNTVNGDATIIYIYDDSSFNDAYKVLYGITW